MKQRMNCYLLIFLCTLKFYFCFFPKNHLHSMKRSNAIFQRHFVTQSSRYFSSGILCSNKDIKIKAFMEISLQRLCQGKTGDTFVTLTRTSVHRMRIAKVREELIDRGLDIVGNRDILVKSLLKALEAEQEQRNTTSSKQNNLQTPKTFHQQETLSSIPNYNNIIQQEPLSAQLNYSSHFKFYPDRTYILRISGNANAQTDRTGIGIIFQDSDDDKLTWTSRHFLSIKTKKCQADYTAIILALKFAFQKGVRKFDIQISNEVVFNHLSGKYPIKAKYLKALSAHVLKYKENADYFSVSLISKLKNADAEELAQRAVATGISLNFDNSLTTDFIQQKSSSLPTNENSLNQAPPSRSNNSSQGIDATEHIDRTVIDPTKVYVLQFDGGARGNPIGKAGAGMVLYDSNGQEIWCGWKFLGTAKSNNQAEYQALLLGLQCSRSLGIKLIRCEGDSDLVIKQLNGVYQTKNPELRILWQAAKNILRDFKRTELIHIFREKNSRADWLANMAMDEQTSYGFEES